MIKIINMSNKKPGDNPWELVVDRSSVVGNIYTIGSRNEMCDKYECWLKSNQHNDDISTWLNRSARIYLVYGKLHLYCWCYPLRCHAESIRELLYDIIDKIGDELI